MISGIEKFVKDYNRLAKADVVNKKVLIDEMEKEVLSGGTFKSKTYGNYEMKSHEAKDGKPHVFEFETIKYFDEENDSEEIIEYKKHN